MNRIPVWALRAVLPFVNKNAATAYLRGILIEPTARANTIAVVGTTGSVLAAFTVDTGEPWTLGRVLLAYNAVLSVVKEDSIELRPRSDSASAMDAVGSTSLATHYMPLLDASGFPATWRGALPARDGLAEAALILADISRCVTSMKALPTSRLPMLQVLRTTGLTPVDRRPCVLRPSPLPDGCDGYYLIMPGDADVRWPLLEPEALA